MTELENDIVLGIQSVYDVAPFELSKEEQEKKTTEIREKTTKTSDKNAEKKAPVKPSQPKQPAQKTAKQASSQPANPTNNRERCIKTIENFMEAYLYLPDFADVASNLKRLEDICDKQVDWTKNAINEIKSDSSVTNDAEFAEIKVQASGFFTSVANTLKAYDDVNIFNQKKQSIENMKSVFLDDEYKKYFEKEGFAKQYNDARKKLELVLKNREKAKQAYEAVEKKAGIIRKDLNTLEVEVNKQKARLQERQK